jgi:DNA-binding CsgD family transcriptional regulator
MRLQDAVRIGVDAAYDAVHGRDFAPELADRVFRVFGADAGSGVIQWRVADGRTSGIDWLTMTGGACLTPEQIADAQDAARHHPSFAAMIRGRTFERLSDSVDLERFWDTDVYRALHGHSEGRYPAAVVLGRTPSSLTFLGVHRQVRDLDEDEVACLVALAEPLRAALAFRVAMDRAVCRLGLTPEHAGTPEQAGQGTANGAPRVAPGGPAAPPKPAGGPFTAREAEVIVLVSRGWTTERIARRLGISPTAVKNRLATARDRVGAATRSELVACWVRDDRPR